MPASPLRGDLTARVVHPRQSLLLNAQSPLAAPTLLGSTPQTMGTKTKPRRAKK
jgi:hypothetical protein